MITIWFEPHATSLDNEAKRASGWNDVDLSEDGLKQAVAMVNRNRERGIKAIFTSDLQRAVKTAIPTADKLQLPIYPDYRLRECDYGDLTQHSKEEVDSEKPQRISTSFPNGESYEECMQRMHAFLDYLKTNFDGKTVLIIGHRATHYGLDNYILKMPLDQCVTQHWTWQPGWKYELI